MPPASMNSSSYTKASIAFFSTGTFRYVVPLIVPEIDHKLAALLGKPCQDSYKREAMLGQQRP